MPEWTRGDRMRKALESAGVSIGDMAEYLGVSRGTVSTWLHDKFTPGRQTMRLWAIRTGAPLEWLESGSLEPPQQAPPATGRRRTA